MARQCLLIPVLKTICRLAFEYYLTEAWSGVAWKKQKKTKPLPQKSINHTKTVKHLDYASARQNRKSNPKQNTTPQVTRNKTMPVKTLLLAIFKCFLIHLNNRLLSVQAHNYALFGWKCVLWMTELNLPQENSQ